MKNILIVLNSSNPSRRPHLEKISSLRDKFLVVLIVDETSKVEDQSPFADLVLPFEMANIDENLPRLLQKIEAVGIPNVVLTLSEFLLPLQARLVEHYGLLGPTQKIAEIGRRKDVMRAFCRDLGIPIPRFKKVGRASLNDVRQFSFPVIVKPTTGGGSQLVQRCNSFEELETIFPELLASASRVLRKEALAAESIRQEGEPPFVVEELIGGQVVYDSLLPYPVGEISVESVYFNGEVRVLAIHDKPLPSNGPYFEEFLHSTPSRISPALAEKAHDYVGRIHKKLGAGALVLHTEFRTIKDDLIVLEFGVRMGGGAIYRSVLHSTGIDMIEVLIDIAHGKKPNVQIQKCIPTISHSIWAEKSGVIKAIHGEQAIRNSPCYVEHTVFDQVGAKVFRAPMSTRNHGQVVLQCREGFLPLEKELIKILDHAWLELEGSAKKPEFINRF